MPKIKKLCAATILVGGLVGAAVGDEPAATVPAQPLLVFAQSRIEVDANGLVVGVEPSPTLPEAVNEALAANLRKLRFAPPLKDGHAVAGVTYARQEACAVPDGGQFRLAVRFLGNGPGALRPQGSLIHPRFPAGAPRAGVSASVKLEYRVMPDGTVSVDTAELLSGRGRFGSEFVQAARTWLDGQRADPELLDGQPVATQVRFTMDFLPGETFYGSNARKQVEKYAQAQAEAGRVARIAASHACGTAARERDAPSEHVAVNSPFQALPTNEALQ